MIEEHVMSLMRLVALYEDITKANANIHDAIAALNAAGESPLSFIVRLKNLADTGETRILTKLITNAETLLKSLQTLEAYGYDPAEGTIQVALPARLPIIIRAFQARLNALNTLLYCAKTAAKANAPTPEAKVIDTPSLPATDDKDDPLAPPKPRQGFLYPNNPNPAELN
jgi:hypothetical protein